MTGMGDDGAAGLGAVQAAGGLTIAQSPDTCVVDSMPRSAIDRGFAMRVVPFQTWPAFLQSKCAPERQAARTDGLQDSAADIITRQKLRRRRRTS